MANKTNETYPKDKVVLRITNGVRYNPINGQKAPGYVQYFTEAEAKLFLANKDILGFKILEVLNDPFKITSFVTSEERGKKKSVAKDAKEDEIDPIDEEDKI